MKEYSTLIEHYNIGFAFSKVIRSSCRGSSLMRITGLSGVKIQEETQLSAEAQ